MNTTTRTITDTAITTTATTATTATTTTTTATTTATATTPTPTNTTSATTATTTTTTDTACLGPAMGLGLACVPNCCVNDGKHQNIYPVSDTAFGVLMGDVAQRVFRIDFWKL